MKTLGLGLLWKNTKNRLADYSQNEKEIVQLRTRQDKIARRIASSKPSSN